MGKRINGAGAGPEQGGVFAQLERLILAIGSASTKREAMTRVQGAIRLTKAISQALAAALQHSAHITGLLVEITDGRLIQLSIPAELEPSTITTLGFLDAKEQPLAMVDPARLIVLFEPKHIEPLTCKLTRKDGTTESHELPALPVAPEPQVAATPPS